MTDSPAAWGTPDWTCAVDYPDHTGPGEMQSWAWEFLRRNDGYRRFWKEKVAPYVSGDPPRIFRNSDDLYWPYLEEAKNDFGVEVPSPPWSKYPAAFITDWTRATIGPANGNLEVKAHEMLFFIDLRYPIGLQFKRFQALATLEQRRRSDGEDIDIKKSRARGNYARYLRILDAENAGAARAQIEESLFPHIDNDHPERRRSHQFDNERRAARRLRDEGYRALAALPRLRK